MKAGTAVGDPALLSINVICYFILLWFKTWEPKEKKNEKKELGLSREDSIANWHQL
jgi:hypothetical protein